MLQNRHLAVIPVEEEMIALMKLHHIRMIAVLIMLIGTYLFLSMIVIAFQGGGLLTGIVLKMFIAGLAAGGVITIVGGILFVRPSLGQLGASQ